MVTKATERRVTELGSRRQKWTEEEAREVLGAWEASGEGLTAFGRRLGVVPQRLSWWRDRIARAKSAPRESWVPIEVRGLGSAAIVVVEGSTRIEVSSADAASAEWVGLLVQALRGSRS
jgi:hypothetical protein